MLYRAELVILVCGFFSVGIDAGQTVFKKPEITSLHIYSDITFRFATTTVTSRIKNVDMKSREAIFDVTLPNEAFITNLTLEIDGKVIIGEIKEKEVARKQYEAAQQRGESAGYIGTRHRETNKFNLAVTVAPQEKISFNLTYQELLKRTRGHYEQVIYIDPGQPVHDMDITVAILESREITDLRVPPLRNDVLADIEDLSTVTVITKPTLKTALVKFVPSIEFQTAQSLNGMAGQFVVQYDVEREMDLGDVLVVNGYFVHFFAPEGFKPIPNDVLFILDTSGSMMGKKLNQLKEAMQSILMQMNEGDRMNIMTFSGSTSFWKTEMVDILNEDTMEEAKSHIESLTAGGWTNIELALTVGITFLRDRDNRDGAVRSPVVVFLTDGEATVGITNPEKILENISSVNEDGIPIFSLAFGQTADYDLVKKISIQNNGLGRKIYEASDAAMQIAGIYNEISVTLLNNITFQYLDAPVTKVTKYNYANYFNGSEMVISGRIETLDSLAVDNAMMIKIFGNSVDGPQLILTGEVSNNLIDLSPVDNVTTSGNFEEITEKVWAYLTIKELLDKELATANEEEKSAFKSQILELSLKYGFVTPLTSMVVTLPNEYDTRNGAFIADEEKPVWKQQLQMIPRRLHSNVVRHSARLTDKWTSSTAFHDTDGYVAKSAVKFGVNRNRGPRRHTKRRHQKKNKRKSLKRSGFQYPLRVVFPKMTVPFCFKLYEDSLENTTMKYILHSDTEADLKVEVKLEKTLVGKWTKQGSIKEIHLISGDNHDIITNETFYLRNVANGVSANNSVPWELVYTPADISVPATEISVKLEELTIVTKVNEGYLSVIADRSTNAQDISANGIIGQIMSKKIEILKKKKSKLNKKRKRKSSKKIAVLKVDGSRFIVMKRKLRSTGGVRETCWALKNKEEQVLDMALARVM